MPLIIPARKGQCILYPKMLSCFLALPAHPLHQGMVKFSGPGSWTVLHTTPAMPALIRMQHDWRPPFFRVWDEYIHLADIHTNITAIADFRLEYYRPGMRGQIWNSIRFLRHTILPLLPGLIPPLVIPVVGFVTFWKGPIEIYG